MVGVERKRGGKNGSFSVRVYDPLTRKKIYVGSRKTKAEAQELFRVESARLSRSGFGQRWVVRAYVERWLREFPRPEETTNRVNEGMLRAFVKEFGDRYMDSIERDEARAFAEKHPANAKAVAAMFSDAVGDGRCRCVVNPFARLGIARGRGRAHIEPLTAEEVDRLAEIALERLGFYGPEFRAIILTAAWVGMRPGEIGGWERRDFIWDGDRLTAHVRRQSRSDKIVQYTKTKRTRIVAVAPVVRDALSSLPQDRDAVFLSSHGKRMRPSSFRYYWNTVRTAFTAELPATHWLPQRIALDPRDNLDIYELRHFCGSFLAHQGLSARDISLHLGNSERECERTYIHPYKDPVRDRVMDAFAARPVVELREVGSQLGRNAAGGPRAV